MRVGRQNFLTDAFDQVRRRFRDLTRLLVSLVNRSDRIGADDFDPRVPLFEIAPRAGNSSAGADAGNKVRDLSLRLLPELGTGGAIVGFGISGMGILIRIERIRSF